MSQYNAYYSYGEAFLPGSTRTCLISAYDIYHKHIDSPDIFPINHLELIFLDSGGYEISEDHEYSSIYHTTPNTKSWTPEAHKEVISSWPDEVPTVIVNYDHPDHRIPVEDQIKEARELFRSCREHQHLFLIKPERKDHLTIRNALQKVLNNIDDLAFFDIIGVTEKELGVSMLERMTSIANLRESLNKAGLDTKIHVFGALDPLTVLLYFVAGAEIFDGLSWIRYAYDQGLCLYFHNYGVLRYGLHKSDRQIKLSALTENIFNLETLEHKMREYLHTGDLSKFAPHQKIIQDARDSLATKIKGEV